MKIILLSILLSMIVLGCDTNVKQFRAEVSYYQGFGITVPVKIGDTTIQMLWDTGCTTTVISEELAKKLSIKLNPNRKGRVSLLKNQLTNKVSNYFEFTIKDTYISEPTTLDISGLRTTSEMLIIKDLLKDSTNNDDFAVLGNDVMCRYYYAMHITDKYLTLSDRPITFDTNQITDSLEFKYSKGNLMVSKVKVNQDSLRLLFDSGMLQSTTYKQQAPIYFDLVFMFDDSTSVSSKVYKNIKSRHNINIDIYTGKELTLNATYSDSVTVNSYPFMSYVQHASVTNDNYDGILSMAFIARFDIMYCNPFDRVIKLYKLKDRESLMKVIPFYEFIKGMNGVAYTEDGDSINHKDVESLIRKRFK